MVSQVIVFEKLSGEFLEKWLSKSALFFLSFVAALALQGFIPQGNGPVGEKWMYAGISVEDFQKWQKSTPELVAKGKQVYQTNCAVCHGAEGKGDGVAGAALNPKPRNFHAPAKDWKNGTSAKAIYVTLAYGIPASPMAAYKAISAEDRWAIVHYIHTFTPEIQATAKGDEKFAKAMEEDGVGGTGAAPKPTLPIDFAIERMAK